ncbi:putative transposase [Phaeobacter inhibens]|nr:putative transposase [Phaeobacter inhibens]
MTNRDHKLSLTRQADLLGISRGSLYYEPRPACEDDLRLMRRIDELHMDYPFAGSPAATYASDSLCVVSGLRVVPSGVAFRSRRHLAPFASVVFPGISGYKREKRPLGRCCVISLRFWLRE